jgi:hypothetical protein
VELALFWQAEGRPEVDYRVRVALEGGSETLVLEEGLPLGGGDHPTSEWQDGEIVRSLHHFAIPASTEAGTYIFSASLTDGLGNVAAAPIQLDRIGILPTERRMTVPATIDHRVDANLGHKVTLLGYDLQVEGGKARVALYWQALREMTVGYKVFVQLVGPGGVLSQWDAAPASWDRPTTGWIEGEVVVDEVVLAIPVDAPKGTYALIAGMYDPDSFERLGVIDAAGAVIGDHVALAEVQVE